MTDKIIEDALIISQMDSLISSSKRRQDLVRKHSRKCSESDLAGEQGCLDRLTPNSSRYLAERETMFRQEPVQRESLISDEEGHMIFSKRQLQLLANLGEQKIWVS